MKHNTMLLVVAVMALMILSDTAAATDVTKITEQISEDARTALNISSADDVLLLTTAGSAKYSNRTTENTLQTVMDSIPQVKYSKILQLNRPDDNPTFIFAVRTGSRYHAKKYTLLQSGTISATDTIYIGPDMTEVQFRRAVSQVGYDTLTILGAWTCGAPYDLLKVAAWTGNVNPSLISAYAASKQFTANYPLGSDNQSYHVIVSAGGGDDDVPMFFMDSTPLKWVTTGKDTYYNFRSSYTADPNENIYIWWDSLAKTGVMLHWTAQTGAYSEKTLEGLRRNGQLISILKASPASLYRILKIASINDEIFQHLWSAGIERDYIAGIRDGGSWDASAGVLPADMYSYMYDSGVSAVLAANQALINAGLKPLGKGDLLITSAGYSETSGLSVGAIDGVMAASGIIFKDVYSLKRGLQTPLWYVFVKKPANPEGPLYAVFVDEKGNIKPVIYSNISHEVFDISAANLMGGHESEGYSRSLAVAGAYGYKIPQYADQDYYIVSLANQWACGMPYDFMLSAVCGGCPGSGLTQGYILSKMIQKWLPLKGASYYIYLGVPAHCKEQALMEVLGLSAGRGTYFTTGTRTASDAMALGIAIRWDPATGTGKAVLVSYDKSIINSIQPASNSYYRTMYWALWYLKYAFPGKELYETVTSAYSISKSVTLTEREYASLLSAGDPVEYIKNFVDVTPPVVSVRISGSTLHMDMNEEGTIFYSLDGAKWQEYTGPVKIMGVTDFYYYATDAAGNRLEIQKLHMDTAPLDKGTSGDSGGDAGESSPVNVLDSPSRGFSLIKEATDGSSEGITGVESRSNESNSSENMVPYAMLALLVAAVAGVYLKRREITRRLSEHSI